MRSISGIQNFNQLFNEYYERFIRFAMSYVRDRQIAEDFVSEAFTSYWEKKDNLLPDTKPQAYILTIIKNKCLNHLQLVQVRQRAEKEINRHQNWLLNINITTLQACDPELIFAEEIRQIVDKTLEMLPRKTRQIFVMNRYQGLSYKDIAEKIHISTKAIEYHISKALQYFRVSLKDFICLVPFLFYFY